MDRFPSDEELEQQMLFDQLHAALDQQDGDDTIVAAVHNILPAIGTMSTGSNSTENKGLIPVGYEAPDNINHVILTQKAQHARYLELSAARGKMMSVQDLARNDILAAVEAIVPTTAMTKLYSKIQVLPNFTSIGLSTVPLALAKEAIYIFNTFFDADQAGSDAYCQQRFQEIAEARGVKLNSKMYQGKVRYVLKELVFVAAECKDLASASKSIVNWFLRELAQHKYPLEAIWSITNDHQTNVANQLPRGVLRYLKFDEYKQSVHTILWYDFICYCLLPMKSDISKAILEKNGTINSHARTGNIEAVHETTRNANDLIHRAVRNPELGVRVMNDNPGAGSAASVTGGQELAFTYEDRFRLAEAKIKADADAVARVGEAQAKADADARVGEAQAKADADARVGEAQAKADADARIGEAQAKADEGARIGEAKAKADADAAARIGEAKAKSDETARIAEANAHADAIKHESTETTRRTESRTKQTESITQRKFAEINARNEKLARDGVPARPRVSANPVHLDFDCVHCDYKLKAAAPNYTKRKMYHETQSLCKRSRDQQPQIEEDEVLSELSDA